MSSFLVLHVALILVGLNLGAPPVESDAAAYDLEDFDLDIETWDLNTDGEAYEYDDLDEEIEVGTVAPPPAVTQLPAVVPSTAHVETATPTTHPVEVQALPTLDFTGPGLFGPETGLGMPTCLLCVCISGSVYCDDTHLDQIPPLPKDTTHFYARFNKIRWVKAKDFLNLNKLKRIDLSGNQISRLDEDVFQSLPQLQELLLADNILHALPKLPATMRHIDARNNLLTSAGIHAEAFKEMNQLEFLYLSNNKLDDIPVPLPESLRVLHIQNNNVQSLHQDTFCNSHDLNYIRRPLEDIRLDGNPIDINVFPQAYICLPRLPTGSSH